MCNYCNGFPWVFVNQWCLAVMLKCPLSSVIAQLAVILHLVAACQEASLVSRPGADNCLCCKLVPSTGSMVNQFYSDVLPGVPAEW